MSLQHHHDEVASEEKIGAVEIENVANESVDEDVRKVEQKAT